MTKRYVPWYNDYGLTKKDILQVKKYIQEPGFREWRLLRDCATEANKEIATELYDSLKSNLSYEKLSCQRLVPISKGDFYVYRRICICMFYKKMNFKDLEV